MKKQPSLRTILWLDNELNAWKNEGIIDEAQYRILSERYPQQDGHRAVSSRFVAALLAIGALILGAGVLLLVASNWHSIPGAVKIAGALVLVCASAFTGFEFRYGRRRIELLGDALIVLSSLCFGAAIWVTAQVLNIDAHVTDGLLVWFFGIIPLVWLERSLPLLLLSIVLLAIWALWESIGFSNPAFLFPLLLVVLVLPPVYIVGSRAALFLAMFASLLWSVFGAFGGSVSDLILDADFLLMALILVFQFGVIAYALGIAHSLFERIGRFAHTYRIFGIVVMFIVLYVFSFRFSDEWIHDAFGSEISRAYPMWVVAAAGFLVSAGDALLLFLIRRDSSSVPSVRIAETIACSLLALLPIVFAIGYFSVIANIVIVVLVIGLLFLGYRSRKKLYVNAGFVFFIVIFFTRYVDLGWMYADRAVFFIITGILVIGGGIALERLRRRFIMKMKEDGR